MTMTSDSAGQVSDYVWPTTIASRIDSSNVKVNLTIPREASWRHLPSGYGNEITVMVMMDTGLTVSAPEHGSKHLRRLHTWPDVSATVETHADLQTVYRDLNRRQCGLSWSTSSPALFVSHVQGESPSKAIKIHSPEAAEIWVDTSGEHDYAKNNQWTAVPAVFIENTDPSASRYSEDDFEVWR